MLQPFLHTLAVYVFLVLAFRFLGQRQLGQMTAVDLAIILVLGSAVETAMVAGNTSLPAGLISAATLLVSNRLLTLALCRSRRWRHIVAGDPMLLVLRGHLLEEHLKRVGMTEADVMEALRERGVDCLDQVRMAVLELDGSVNVVTEDRKGFRTKRDVRKIVPRAGSVESGDSPPPSPAL